MIAIVTILFAFPLGFFLRNRTMAYVVYVALYGYSFTFQGLYLLRSWIDDHSQAFPSDPEALPLGYLAVTAGIYLAGFGLVTLGHRLGGRRRARRAARPATAVDLDPAR